MGEKLAVGLGEDACFGRGDLDGAGGLGRDRRCRGQSAAAHGLANGAGRKPAHQMLATVLGPELAQALAAASERLKISSPRVGETLAKPNPDTH